MPSMNLLRVLLAALLGCVLGAPALVAAQAPPPAPVETPSRQEVIEILRRPDIDHCLPITLGTGAPTAVLRREGTRWVIRHLTADPRELEDARRESMARHGHWVPEQAWRHLRPGRVLLEGSSQAELLARVEAMSDWVDRYLGAERPPGASRALRFCPARAR